MLIPLKKKQNAIKSDNDENQHVTVNATNHKDDDDDDTKNSHDHENSNGSTKSNPVSVEERLKALIDTNKLACLLCKRQFDSIDILNKHTVKSDLHKVKGLMRFVLIFGEQFYKWLNF